MTADNCLPASFCKIPKLFIHKSLVVSIFVL